MNFIENVYYSTGKFIANMVAVCILDKEKRHRMRNALNPLNPEGCVRYICRHYASKPSKLAQMPERKPSPVYIWQCWLQGEEQAPQLVKDCIASVRHFKRPDQQHVIITAQNYSSYVNLPDYIIMKWQKGIITNTHFSDLLRIYLLSKYGGYWMDATCLLITPIPEQIEKNPVFMFHAHGEFSYTLIQSCFIYCQANNYLIRRWCEVLDDYWLHEQKLIQYFLLHLSFKALLLNDQRFSDAYQRIPVISDEKAHLMLYAQARGERDMQALLKQIKEAGFWQKLTYKVADNEMAEWHKVCNTLIEES